MGIIVKIFFHTCMCHEGMLTLHILPTKCGDWDGDMGEWVRFAFIAYDFIQQ